MNTNHLISVIIPCYNQALYLDECLQSVLEQSYQNWECIIVNDGSLDSTEEIAINWTKKDSRFKYLSKENGGLSSARNAGIEIAEGKWILPLDSDDKIGNLYLELAEKQFDKGYSIIYCEANFFGDKQGLWELPEFSLNSLAEKNNIFCTAFYKKNDWLEVNGYDTTFIHGLEDWDLWISILKKQDNINVLKLNYVGFYYRIKKSSMITNLQGEKRRLMYKIIFTKHIDFFIEEHGGYHINLMKINELRNESKQLRGLFSSKIFRILLKLGIFKTYR